MSYSKQKFIMTMDESTANKFMAAGFKLISHVGNSYTFLNQFPTNFNFEQFDKTKFTYTNMLSI